MCPSIRHAREIIRASYEEYGPSLVAVTSFGRNAGLLCGLVAQVKPEIPFIHVNTGDVPRVNEAYARRLQRSCSLHIIECGIGIPVTADELQMRDKDEQGWRLFYERRKVQPLMALLARRKVRAILSGVRSDQNEHRQSLRTRERWGDFLRIYPTLEVTAEVARLFLKEHDIPTHDDGPPGFKTGNECGLHENYR